MPVLLNLHAINTQMQTIVPRAALAAAQAGPPAPAPAPTQGPKKIQLNLAGAAARNLAGNVQVTPEQSAQAVAAALAREAVYNANGGRGPNQTQDVHDAAEAAAGQAAAMMAAHQAGGDVPQIAVDTTTGDVTHAADSGVSAFEQKIVAAPLWAKALGALAGVFVVGKLVRK